MASESNCAAPLNAQNEEEVQRKAARRSAAISALGNLSTAYGLVNINLASTIMENEYCGGDNCDAAAALPGTACIVGVIAGQLTFGYVGDCLGRNPALKLCMVLTVLGALLSAFAIPLDSNHPETVFVFLSFSRAIMGIGVGGVYPIAATISAESASNANRGRQGALVFSMQGIGTLLVPVIGMICLYSLGQAEYTWQAGTPLRGISWRVILGIGALPGLVLLVVRSAPKESPRPQTAAARPTTMTLGQAIRVRRYWPKLLGCAGSWFVQDITFYGNRLNQPTVMKAVFHHQGEIDPIGPTLADNLCWQLFMLALIGLPGYYVSVWLMDTLGRKTIQLQGFAIMTVLYGGLGLFLNQLENQPALFIFIYGLTLFFTNFGPNSTTFILPSETFPPEVRTTFNGFCAACGKCGAGMGCAFFQSVIAYGGTNVLFYVCSACSLIGVLLTAFFVEDRRFGMGGTSQCTEECSAS